MKLGQFCGLVADLMEIRHSEFVQEAESLFFLLQDEPDAESSDLWEHSLPDREVDVADAAMIAFLVVAYEFHGFGEPGNTAESARQIAAIGDNLPSLFKAIKTGESVSVDLSCRLETLVTIPASLTQAMSRVVSSAKPVKLKTV